MAYAVRVLADSISPEGVRLTTLEVTMPRFVLAEFNTHRDKSRNSASSRAIPVEKRIAMIESDPFIPEVFGKNQKGMQADATLEAAEAYRAEFVWQDAMRDALRHARRLADLGVHKQLANRLLEPFAWHTMVVTATEWENYFGLRVSELAQPEIEKPSRMMMEAIAASEPKLVSRGHWHLPLVPELDGEVAAREELRASLTAEQWAWWAKISCARAARVSYLTHDGKRDLEADEALYHRLVSYGHMSPLEHAARPMQASDKHTLPGYYELAGEPWAGNFRGWVQHRKLIPGENVFSSMEH